MGYLIKQGLKTLTKTFNNAEILNLNNGELIGLIDANTKIVNIKLFANDTISFFGHLQVIDSQTSTNVALLNITQIDPTFNFYFNIGFDNMGNVFGFNLKKATTNLILISQSSPSSIATELTIEISYFI
jgi:hypothetical protein